MSTLNVGTIQNLSTLTASGQVSVGGNLLMNSGYGSAATAYGCRAWVNFSGSAPSIRASGNVTSISKPGTGYYTVNFTTAMVDANYSVTAMADGVYNGNICSIGHGDSDNTGMASGSVRVESRGGQGSGGAFDATYYCVAVFR